MATSILVEHDSLEENRRKICPEALVPSCSQKANVKTPFFLSSVFTPSCVNAFARETLRRTKILG